MDNNKENEYYSQIREEMLEFIPFSAKTILDVGCGQGLFSNLIKRNRQAEVWGIEKELTVASEAKKNLDK
jgi:2-polyprenyl-3-methyl-5-hydroxy-6-metoxy-1,4-benzoquinol methylase